LGEKDRAFDILLDAAPLLEDLRQEREYRNTLILLGHIKRERGEFEDALNAYQAALRLFDDEIMYSENMCTLLCSTGEINLEMERFTEAIAAFKYAAHVAGHCGFQGWLSYATELLEKAQQSLGGTTGSGENDGSPVL
jgi:Tfp pilus assembly protein PilF